VSAVSAHAGVRRAIVPQQRAIAERGPGVVAEGRDTASVVFPDADHKFFLTASAAERARRRAVQRGHMEELAAIRADIERRDRLDSERGESPLRLAPGAEEFDTDGLAAPDVVRALLERIRRP
jgi:pantoate ligase/cytidylate kinase